MTDTTVDHETQTICYLHTLINNAQSTAPHSLVPQFERMKTTLDGLVSEVESLRRWKAEAIEASTTKDGDK